MQKLVKIIIVSLFCFLLNPFLSKASSHKDDLEKMDRKELRAEIDSIKARKISYKQFKEVYSINDTTDVIIDIFLIKKLIQLLVKCLFYH